MLLSPRINQQRINGKHVFLFFVAFLVIQHALVFLYHDDYGLAVLWYNIHETGFIGQDFSVHQAWHFLAGIYDSWSGRVVSIGAHIYAQKVGLWFVRGLQVLIIVATLLTIVLITQKEAQNNRHDFLLILSVAAYLTIPPFVSIDGIYWFSAASGYLWGLPILLAGVYLSSRQRQFSAAAAILVALAATFHEQIACASLVYVLAVITLRQEWKTQPRASLVAKILPIVIAAAFTVLAPGNFSRQQSSAAFYSDKSFYTLIETNLERLMSLLFWPQRGNPYLLIMAGSLLCLFLIIWQKTPAKSVKIWNLTCLIATCYALFVCYHTGNFFAFGIVLLGVHAVMMIYVTTSVLSTPVMAAVYLASIASLGLLLFAPGIPDRAVIPYMFLSLPAYFYSVAIVNNPRLRIAQSMFAAVLLTFGSINAVTVFSGYLANYHANAENDSRLRTAYLSCQRTGQCAEHIELLKLPQPRYANVMPYDRPLIEQWMKQYYRLPQHIQFIWYSPLQ